MYNNTVPRGRKPKDKGPVNFNPMGVYFDRSKTWLFALAREKKGERNKLFRLPKDQEGEFSWKQRRPVEIAFSQNTKTFEFKHVNNFQFFKGRAVHCLGMSYTRLSRSYYVLAKSKDLDNWEAGAISFDPQPQLTVIPEYKLMDHYVSLTSDDDNRSIRALKTNNFKIWSSFYPNILQAREGMFDDTRLRVISASEVPEGILLLYYARNTLPGKGSRLKVGAALLDKKNLGEILWRANHPLWEGILPAMSDPKILGTVISPAGKIKIYISPKRGELGLINFGQPLFH